MDKYAQPFSPEEAKKWVVESPERWKAGERFEAARKFFQVWNKKRGAQRASKDILADEPLRCTIWRDRAMDYERLLQDIIAEALPAYSAALQQVLPELERAAQTNPNLLRRLNVVKDIISGKTGETLKGLWEERKEKLLHEPAGKEVQPATKVVSSYYYEILDALPALQKKFVELAAKDLYTRFGKGPGGYWAGRTSRKEVRRLLTFFLMKDPYPYFRSEPLRPNGERYTKETSAELCNDWGGKTSEENPAPGRAMSKKVTYPFATYKCPNGDIVVKNDQNPEYDFAKVTGEQARDPKLLKETVADIVSKTRTAALFNPEFALAKNVFKHPGTKYEEKGIFLDRVGRADIDVSDRDVTELEDGGLFWVPKSGVPKSLKAPQEKVKVEPSGKFHLPPKEQSLTDGLRQVFGQTSPEESTTGIWIDDQGKMYDSMDQVLAVYDKERSETLEKILPKALEEAIREDLEGAEIPDVPMYDVEEEPEPEPEPVEEEEEEPKVLYPWEQVEEDEEELAALPLAARRIDRLIRLANILDSKGLSEQANVVDEVIKGLVEQMTRQNP